MKATWFIVSILGLGLVGPAMAVRVAGEPAQSAASKVQAATTVPATAASSADDNSSLREGVITAISDKRDQIEVNGSWLKVVDGKTRVFRQGRAVNPGDELVKGTKVKFTLAPGAADRLTLGVVYVP